MATCLAACAVGGYTYCGVEYGNECFASNTAPDESLMMAGVSGDLIGEDGCVCLVRGMRVRAVVLGGGWLFTGVVAEDEDQGGEGGLLD